MKTKKTNFKMLLWAALMLPLLLTLKPLDVQASHFRYGHLTWQPLTGNTVRFTLTCAFRRDGFQGTAPDTYVAVGDTFNEDIGFSGFSFGDGSNTGVLEFKVTAIDVANNWCLARALEPTNYAKTTIDHSYATPNNGGLPWLAEINDCCRTYLEHNNPSGNYRVLTYVETSSGNRSPSSSLPAIINLMHISNASFVIPAVDPDPNTVLRFRLATPTEAGNGAFNQPTGLTIDPATGVVSWNTLLNADVDSFYSCQVVIEDHAGASTGPIKTTVAVDFLIHITPAVSPCDLNLAPYFIAPSPSCGSTLNAVEFAPFSFTMKATDPDAGNIVTLNSGGGPSGSTFTPGLPTTGHIVSTVFNWTPPIGSAGSYVVTFSATDSCGAQTLCSVNINVAACRSCHLGVNLTKLNPSCCGGGCNGSITAVPINGNPNYTYLWSNGKTTATVHNLCGQTYTVTVTDARGCKKSVSGTLVLTPPIHLTTTPTNIKCKGSNSGAIALTVTGGSPAYSYLWSNGATDKNISGLSAGTYTVTVTDSRGCTARAARVITQPASAITQTISQTATIGCSTVCFGCGISCTGTATSNPTGGLVPYSYLWSNGVTTKTATGLCALTYTVTVTDKNGCANTKSVTITGGGAAFTLDSVLTPNTNCGTNHCNGSVTVIPSIGAISDYTYVWNTGETTNGITNKCAGSYSVTVANAQGCSQTHIYQIINHMVLHYGSFEQTDETCKRACDGTIAIINDFGSTGYLWSNGATTVSIDDLCGGDVYSFTITYGDYCTQGYSQILIGGPDAIDAQCTVTADESGNGAADGSITAINETGGTPPYSYLWSNGETTQAISGLTSGDYTVSVTDSHQCPNDQSTCSVITIPHRLTQSNDDFGKQISISPNPFVNALSINVTSDEALTITVTDAMGRVVNQYNNVQQSLKMNGDWHNGIYLIRVENTSGSFRKTLKAARVE